jgi:hypothetical protein
MCLPTYTQVFLRAHILRKAVLSFSSKHGSRTGKSGKVSSVLKALPVGKYKNQLARLITV